MSLSARQFVLDSTVDASVQSGLYQRNPDTTVTLLNSPYDINTYQPYNQVPLPASLVIGTSGGISADLVVGNVTVASGFVLPALVNANGTPFNPFTDDPASDPLPASYTASVLRPQLLGAQGFGDVSIYANGKFLDPASVALQFPAGGSFSVTANLIDLEGQITVPGGSITALAEPTLTSGSLPAAPFALTLGPHAALTADGEWVNDNPLLYPSGNTAPLFINGGKISLTAETTQYSPGLLLAPGSRIDVSGGGQLTTTGALNPGVGGTISLAAEYALDSISAPPSAAAPPRLELGATLSGYGLYDGGTLSLTDAAVCIAVANCSGGNLATLWVSPAELAAGGFSDYQLTADQGGLSVAPGTTVTLKQRNFVLPNNPRWLADQSSLCRLGDPCRCSPISCASL